MKGRLFSVVVHGDVEGTKDVRRSLSDWLKFMEMQAAGPLAEVDRYIGYWEPYATNHDALDQDLAIQGEVRNAAHTLLDALLKHRGGAAIPAIGLAKRIQRRRKRQQGNPDTR